MHLMLWSAPRSRSTAFFRMMAERGDFTLVHEPFSYLVMYGHTDVGGTRVTSGPELLKVLLELPGQVFVKDTTGARYPEFLATPEFLETTQYLDGVTHTFLIRDPRETIPSYLKLEPGTPIERIGFEVLHDIYTAVAERTGRPPVVIDAADLVRDPEGTVKAYCTATGIPFIREALSWDQSQRPEWQLSRRWHEGVAASTGLGALSPGSASVPGAGSPVFAGSVPVPDAEAAPYLRHHLPYYEALHARRLTPA
jgi:hypothetical protein